MTVTVRDVVVVTVTVTVPVLQFQSQQFDVLPYVVEQYQPQQLDELLYDFELVLYQAAPNGIELERIEIRAKATRAVTAAAGSPRERTRAKRGALRVAIKGPETPPECLLRSPSIDRQSVF